MPAEVSPWPLARQVPAVRCASPRSVGSVQRNIVKAQRWAVARLGGRSPHWPVPAFPAVQARVRASRAHYSGRLDPAGALPRVLLALDGRQREAKAPGGQLQAAPLSTRALVAAPHRGGGKCTAARLDRRSPLQIRATCGAGTIDLATAGCSDSSAMRTGGLPDSGASAARCAAPRPFRPRSGAPVPLALVPSGPALREAAPADSGKGQLSDWPPLTVRGSPRPAWHAQHPPPAPGLEIQRLGEPAPALRPGAPPRRRTVATGAGGGTCEAPRQPTSWTRSRNGAKRRGANPFAREGLGRAQGWDHATSATG